MKKTYENEFKIAICDDEKLSLEIIKSATELVLNKNKILKYNIALFDSPLRLLKEPIRYHLVILDVEMPDMNGFDVAKELRNQYDMPPMIIFFTNHSEMIERGYEVRAFRYLKKPLEVQKFEEAVVGVVKEFLETDIVIFEINKEKHLVNILDIKYIESLGEGCCFHVGDSLVVREEPLKYWLHSLPEQVIIQVHKSYVVNLRYVKKIGLNKLVLKTDETIPISVRRKKYVMNKLHEFIRRRATYK